MAGLPENNVFNFMSLRAPQSIDDHRIRHFYVKDETVLNGSRAPRDAFAKDSLSLVGNLLFQKIFCEGSDASIEDRNNNLILDVLELLEKTTISCDPTTGITNAAILNQAEQQQLILHNNSFYKLKTRIKDLSSEFDRHKLIKARQIIRAHTETYNRKALLQTLRELFEVDHLLAEVIFSGNSYENNYQQMRNVVFDNLYILYILRRISSINLEEMISGLQTLHTLEILAIEDLLDGIKETRVDPTTNDTQSLIGFLNSLYPELEAGQFTNNTITHLWIKDKKELQAYMESSPIVHPLVARLHWYKGFNNIKPIGMGDLMVVKQKLLGYQVGEIARIHNVMQGESNDLITRKLEKSEESFSFMDENSSSSQSESQQADRFEVKKEAESVIKTDINVGANANFTYNNTAYGITTSVGGNFAYANSKQEAEKTASNFARDVMEKAVTNIQNRSSKTRTVTKIFESEETNKQSFTNNKQDDTHISGIYRWLDKKYEAQLYSYGKRLMFEFIIPEPAAFYVESKLRATEFDINLPQKPEEPGLKNAQIFLPGTTTELKTTDIDEQVFNELRKTYDLAEFSFPARSMDMPFSDQEKKNNLALATNGAGNRVWTNTQYRSKCPAGYNVSYVSIVGTVKFAGKEGVVGGEPDNDGFEDNKWLFMLNGVPVWDERSGNLNTMENHFLDNVVTPTTPIKVNNEELVLDISFQDLDRYSMMVYVGLIIDDNYLLDFRNKVYSKIRSIEQKKVDLYNQEQEISYKTAMTDYRNKLNELNAQTVNDIIQGRSEAFNATIIAEELKKHCITMIAKEFDALTEDDILSNEDAIDEVEVNMRYDKFFAGEVPKLDDDMASTMSGEKIPVAEFLPMSRLTTYPKIKIDTARKKARYIQFLEQAFEWHNIAYLFYPYFWAHESKWVKLMNRLDYTDNNMTAFLKAGSARVLIAVTPAYNDAVMHFLETRQPWEGGDLPVIGDPLFIPLYEELRKQQDDLYNATKEGKPWKFMLPTSLVYLQDSSSPIPTDLKPPTS